MGDKIENDDSESIIPPKKFIERVHENAKPISESDVKNLCNIPDFYFESILKDYIYEINFPNDCKFKTINTLSLISHRKKKPELYERWPYVLYYAHYYSISLPPSIVKIGYDSFMCCPYLSQVIFQKNDNKSCLQIIERRAFSDTKIQSISIPDSICELGDHCFPKVLNKITFENGAPNLKSIGNYAFDNTQIETFSIPLNIKPFIKCVSFLKCKKLKTITFDDFIDKENPPLIDSSKEEIKENKIKEKKQKIFENLIKSVNDPDELLIHVRYKKRHIFYFLYHCQSHYHYYKSYFTYFHRFYYPFSDYDEDIENIDLYDFYEYVYETKHLHILRSFNGHDKAKSFLLSRSKIENLDIFVSNINKFYFFNTPNLTNIRVFNNENSRYIKDNGCLYTKDLKKLIVAERNIKKAVIKAECEVITNYAFNIKCLEKVSFEKNSQLKEISICAFSESQIKQIAISNKVDFIGYGAFYNCTKLESINIPTSLILIDFFTFSMTNLTEIKIPKNITRIKYGCFYKCKNLQKVIFEDNSNLIEIDDYAFAFTKIKDISIPKSVRMIGNFAFLNCKKLKSIQIDEESNLVRIGYDFLWGTLIKKFSIPKKIQKQISSFDDYIIYPSTSYLLEFYGLSAPPLTHITIPSNIKAIGNSAFSDFKHLTSVEINDISNSNLLEIRRNAFTNCTSLIEFKLPKSVQYFGERCFMNCFKYKAEINICKKNIIYVYDSAFENSGIISFDSKSNYIIIKENAFLNCENLTNISVNAKLKCKIGCSAFMNCKSLKTAEIAVNTPIISIGKYCFMNSSLESFKVPIYLSMITESCFKNCTHLNEVIISEESKIKKFSNEAFYGSAIESINIPSNTKDIGECCFQKCSNLKKVTFSNLVQINKISEESFESCGIEEITFPSTIEYICKSSFQNCKKLGSVTILGNDVYIETLAFAGCDSLQQINFNTQIHIKPLIPDFLSIYNDYLFCKKEKMDKAFINAVITNNEPCFTIRQKLDRRYFFIIKEGYQINHPFVFYPYTTIRDIKMVSYLNGGYYSYFEKDLLLCDFSAHALNIPKETQEIKEEALRFSNITNVYFETDSQLKIINKLAFESLAIEEISLPNSLTFIGKSAFMNCTKLRKVNINKTSHLKTIKSCAFEYTSIETIVFPSNLEEIGPFAFYKCKKLKNIVNYSNKIKIGESSFAHSSIEMIKFPSYFVFEVSSFQYCRNLKKLMFLEKPKKLVFNEESFSFSGLEEIDLNCIVNIKSNAFAHCESLKNVNLNCNKNIHISKEAFINSYFDTYLRQNSSFQEAYDYPELMWEYMENKNNKLFKVTKLVMNLNQFYLTVSLPILNRRHYITQSIYSDQICNTLNDTLNYVNLIDNAILYKELDSEIEYDSIKPNEILIIPSYVKKLDFNYSSHIKKIIWEPGCCINDLGPPGFFAYYNLIEITIPKFLRIIPARLFEHCNFLKIVQFEENSNLIEIGEFSFAETKITEIKIPVSVKIIRKSAFQYVKTLSKVEFKGEIIEDEAFLGTGITEFILSNRTESIGKSAFRYCHSLSNLQIDINASCLSEIGSFAFSETPIKNINIPPEIRILNEGVFNGCKLLENVSISEKSKLEKIDKYSFACNLSLTSINIPQTIKTLSQKAFINTPLLISIMNQSNEYFNVMEDNSVYSQKNNKLIFVPRNIAEYIIQPNCEIVCSGAFCGPIIEKVTFSDNLTKRINSFAFAHSTGLKEFQFPSSIQYIGEDAFIDCQNLETVTFESKCQIKEIPKFCFAFSGLTTISFPKSIRKLNHSCFYFCQNLKMIDLYNTNIKYIGDYSFSCTDLKEIKFSPSIIHISSHAFDGNQSLKIVDLSELNISDKIPNYYKIFVEGFNQEEDEYEEDKSENEATTKDTTKYKIAPPDDNMNHSPRKKVTKITSHTIKKTSKITKNASKIIIPKTQKNRLQLHNKEGKNNPKSNHNIMEPLDDEQKKSPRNLNKLNNQSESPEDLNGNLNNEFEFDQLFNKVIDRKIESDFNEKLNKNFDEIFDNKFDQLIKEEIIEETIIEEHVEQKVIEEIIDDQEKMIESEHEEEQEDHSRCKNSSCFVHKYAFCNCSIKIVKFNLKEYKWFNFLDQCNKIDEYIVNGNLHLFLQKVTNENFIRHNLLGTFYEIQNLFLKKPSLIPLSSTSRQKEALITPFHFYDFSNITTINFDDNIEFKEIPRFCFQFSSLIELSIPKSVRVINKYAFKYCENLMKINIPDESELQMIGEGSFFGCYKLSTIFIPNSIKTIPKKCFSFSGLENIELPNSVKKIEKMAFYCCKKLSKVIMKEGIIQLDEFSFANDISLQSINIPDSLQTINSYAFSYCTQLSQIKTTKNTNLVKIFNGAFEFTLIEELGMNKSATQLFDPINVPNLNKIYFYNGKPSYFIQFKDGTIYEKTDEYNHHINIYFNYNDSIPEYAFDELDLCIINRSIDDSMPILKLVFAPKNLECLKIHPNCFLHNDHILYDMKNLNTIEYMKGPTNFVQRLFTNTNSIKKIRILGQHAVLSWYCELSSLEIIEFGELTKINDIFHYNRSQKLQSIIIPPSCNIISGGAFENCINLKSVEFKSIETSDLKSIESKAFYCCSSLTSIEIPLSVTKIDCQAFMNCTKLEAVKFVMNKQCDSDNSLKMIRANAFKNCSSLKYFCIPETCSFIGEGVFMNCTSLKKIEFTGSSIISIPDQAFYNCTSLTRFQLSNIPFITNIDDNKKKIRTKKHKLFNPSIKMNIIKDKQFSIGVEAFMNCTSLKEIIIEDESKFIDTIKLDKNNSPILVYPNQCNNIDWNLIWSSIKKKAFYNCKSLIRARFFLGNLQRFNDDVFMNCSSLKSIEINSQYCRLLLTDYLYMNPFVGTPDDLIIKIFNNDKYLMNFPIKRNFHHYQKRHYKEHLSHLNTSFFDIQDDNQLKSKSLFSRTFEYPTLLSDIHNTKMKSKNQSKDINYCKYYCLGPSRFYKCYYYYGSRCSFHIRHSDHQMIVPDSHQFLYTKEGKFTRPSTVFNPIKPKIFESNQNRYKNYLSKLNKSFLKWEIPLESEENKEIQNPTQNND